MSRSKIARELKPRDGPTRRFAEARIDGRISDAQAICQTTGSIPSEVVNNYYISETYSDVRQLEGVFAAEDRESMMCHKLLNRWSLDSLDGATHRFGQLTSETTI